MVKAQTKQTEQPIKTLRGMNCQLELYKDRVVIQRTDPLAKLVPSMFDDLNEIPLDEVLGVYLYESRYYYSRWISFIVQDIHRRRMVMLFDRELRAEADALKRDIEAIVDKRLISKAVQV